MKLPLFKTLWGAHANAYTLLIRPIRNTCRTIILLITILWFRLKGIAATEYFPSDWLFPTAVRGKQKGTSQLLASLVASMSWSFFPWVQQVIFIALASTWTVTISSSASSLTDSGVVRLSLGNFNPDWIHVNAWADGHQTGSMSLWLHHDQPQ